MDKLNAEYWERVKGFITPGGDPVYVCPQCNGGRHVYGIEHLKNYMDKCPDCGIKLKYC